MITLQTKSRKIVERHEKINPFMRIGNDDTVNNECKRTTRHEEYLKRRILWRTPCRRETGKRRRDIYANLTGQEKNCEILLQNR